MKPKKVTRLALRYINRLTLPASGDLGEYMRTHPRLGPALPQEMRNFFMRVEVPFTDESVAIITQTVVPREPGADERDLILNVDAVSVKEFDASDPQNWHELDELSSDSRTNAFSDRFKSRLGGGTNDGSFGPDHPVRI